MAGVFVCVYHFLVWGWYIFINYSISLPRAERQPSDVFHYGRQWKYLTVLNLLLQAIYYGVTCLDGVLKRTKKMQGIKFVISSRDLFFTVLAFPVSAFVFLVFWALYLYNRELIFPESLEKLIPGWLNHAMHTAILPISLIEVMITPHRYSSKKKGLLLLGCSAVAYICWVLWIYTVTGKWVYPIFSVLSPVSLAAFFFFSYVLIVCIYLLGEQLNRLRWGDNGQHKKRKGK
ncbi:androgen-dependent TFPI-regulating protein [Tachyglossus aculeatus]|uniref:androgen-dependent TFPI-regulating protein n=1 Tax=Tachyglossus aculeatus TaxID=9261 RepID=UPI0018F370F1|nr:androgen-dependent TFPI-regulating protein [Tachyglossus aculeatus]